MSRNFFLNTKDREVYYGEYYEQGALWGGSLGKDEQDRVVTTFSLIPKDTKTILDVGCGDGRITNELALKYNVTGMDISKEALKYVKTKKILGSIDKMSSSNNSFDLVSATEVLEHIPAVIFDKAISEIERVSKKYILISVPYKENLYASVTKCKKCKNIFHLWRHLRCFTKSKLNNLFQNYRMVDYVTFGHRVNYYNNFLLFIKYCFGNKWNVSDKALCPKCGTRDLSHSDKVNFFAWIVNGILWRLNKIMPERLKRKRWIAVLYRKVD